MQVKAAFTMIESLFCMSILSLMLYLSVPNTKLNFNHFINPTYGYTHSIEMTQLQAMTTKSKKELIIDEQVTEFTFNSLGNINHAGTLLLNGTKCVFQLGTGRFYFE